MWRLPVVATLAGALVSAKPDADHCTAIVVGGKASASGAPMVGQTDDSEGGPGTSLIYVPAQDHAPGSMRPILDQTTRNVIDYIPQVAHTYAYTYMAYGVMNEHKVAIGESTCSARITASSRAHGGTALFSNEQMTMVALERCKTARCTVEMMGDLAQNHGGFYGEDSGVDTGGEALLVADSTEAWVFHVLADPSGKSAIWAAQRVPDDHIAAVPNIFVIRDMNLSSSDYILSSNAHDVASKYGWWKGQDRTTFNFAAAFSLGEYANPFYSARRMWRIYDLVAPSLKLSPFPEITDTNAGYPFSVKPDNLLKPSDIFRIYRDYLEGTAFSLVADNPAAGPFNSPLRVASGAAEAQVPTGAWERPISIYRADYALINECHPDGNGIVWVAPHTAHASVFAPVWSSGAADVARPYHINTKIPVDRASLWWAASAVSNWAFGTMFSKAIVDIREQQAKVEPKCEAVAESLRKSSESPSKQSEALAKLANEVHGEWWDLFWNLMGKYSDGYVVNRDPKTGSFTPEQPGYPAWWLSTVDFAHGVACPAESFQNLHDRMSAAAKVMDEIEKERHGATSMAATGDQFVVYG